jgi:hypothetical protein
MGTAIAYDHNVENLIDELSATGHVTHQSFKKTSVTLHHNGGRNTLGGLLEVWKTRPASAHFDVDASGNVAQYVKVDEYAWAVGNGAGNESTISIEMCDETLAPQWKVGDVTLASAERLAAWLFVHVIGARPNTGNFFPHRHWSSTDCPGPYVMNQWNAILLRVQAAYDAFKGGSGGGVVTPPSGGKESIVVVAHEVINGKWGNGPDRVSRLIAAGYNPAEVQAEVNAILRGQTPAPAKESISQLAHEVIEGKWGNGPDRVARLRAAGYDPNAVQAEVNRELA